MTIDIAITAALDRLRAALPLNAHDLACEAGCSLWGAEKAIEEAYRQCGKDAPIPQANRIPPPMNRRALELADRQAASLPRSPAQGRR